MGSTFGYYNMLFFVCTPISSISNCSYKKSIIITDAGAITHNVEFAETISISLVHFDVINAMLKLVNGERSYLIFFSVKYNPSAVCFACSVLFTRRIHRMTGAKDTTY